MELQEHVWKHINNLNNAIGEETDTIKLLKLHEELNGYLFAIIFEQMGDLSKAKEELKRLKNSNTEDSTDGF